MVWRFDQGRLDYFNFDEIKRISFVLGNINGIPKPDISNDILRRELGKFSPRPFHPNNYTVWRNYKRVLSCALLATELEGRIVITDLCKFINNNIIDTDDYFAFFARKFYFPSPIFDGYNVTEQQVFPVPSILKFLLARYIHSGKNFVSVDDIGCYLIANGITGLEPITYYESLTPKIFNGDLRQVRELVKFISQFSFLKWQNPYLFFDIPDQQEMNDIINRLEPILEERNPNPAIELLNIASIASGFFNLSLGDFTIQRTLSFEREFSEGNRIRAIHIRTERSIKLKDFFFKYTKNPEICSMCGVNTKIRYPWTEYIIDIHHLLPLSSPVRVENNVTSFKDIVGVCPTCHRAIHKYYSIWLVNNKKDDFASKNEANTVYLEAKHSIALEGYNYAG